MKSKYNINPLYNLYSELYGAIIDDNNEYNNDEILDAILRNNGYIIDDNYKAYLKEICDDFFIYFTYGCRNEDNDPVDYVEVYGTKFIIVMVNYFKSLKDTEISSNPLKAEAQRFMGHSNEFTAIKYIVELFISISSGNTKAIENTIQGKINLHAGSFIAGKIINNICGLTENDVDGNLIPYDVVIDNINKNFGLVLLGIN